MAIKIAGTTVIDDSLNIKNIGVATATTFVGALTGNATGLSGTPNITVGNITGSAATFTNLTVNGTQTIINTTSLEISDKNIGIGSTSSPSDALADGAGITIYGTTNKTITWSNTTKNWTFVGGGVTVSDLSVSGIATISDYDGNFILDSYLFNS